MVSPVPRENRNRDIAIRSVVPYYQNHPVVGEPCGPTRVSKPMKHRWNNADSLYRMEPKVLADKATTTMMTTPHTKIDIFSRSREQPRT